MLSYFRLFTFVCNTLHRSVLSREICSVCRGRVADDGKHASSVIEVENSLLEAKLEGGVEGDVLGMPREACG